MLLNFHEEKEDKEKKNIIYTNKYNVIMQYLPTNQNIKMKSHDVNTLDFKLNEFLHDIKTRDSSLNSFTLYQIQQV